MGQKYEVTGHSGRQEVVEADSELDAKKQYVDHHGEPARWSKPVQEAVITERDTSDV